MQRWRKFLHLRIPDLAARHCHVDVERTGSAAGEATTQPSELDTRHLTPVTEGTCSSQAMVSRPPQVTAITKEISQESSRAETA